MRFSAKRFSFCFSLFRASYRELIDGNLAPYVIISICRLINTNFPGGLECTIKTTGLRTLFDKLLIISHKLLFDITIYKLLKYWYPERCDLEDYSVHREFLKAYFHTNK